MSKTDVQNPTSLTNLGTAAPLPVKPPRKPKNGLKKKLKNFFNVWEVPLVTGAVLVGLFGGMALIFGVMYNRHMDRAYAEHGQYMQECEENVPMDPDKLISCLNQRYVGEFVYVGGTGENIEVGFIKGDESSTCRLISPERLDVVCANDTYLPLSDSFKTRTLEYQSEKEKREN